MSIASIILGESGSGKSTSMMNMDPKETLLIQVISKPLPFKNKLWKPVQDGGNILVSADANFIATAMDKTARPVVVVDDMQYLLATEFMARAYETGYTKFTDMAKNYYNVLTKAANLADANKRVYFLSHVDTDERGQIRAKTIGKLLNEKLTVEGFVTMVLRAQVINGKNVFSTRNSGGDTVKSPLGLFADEHIDNDLAAVDKALVAYYELSSPNTATGAN